jgi:hypothetical protein
MRSETNADRNTDPHATTRTATTMSTSFTMSAAPRHRSSIHRRVRAVTWLNVALATASPVGCREPREATRAPQGPASIGPTSAAPSIAVAPPPARAASTATESASDVLARVDGIEIHQEAVDAWILGVATAHRDAVADPTPKARAAAINSLIYAQLLREKCQAVCRSAPPTAERCACNSEGAERTVAEALGMYTPTEADITAEYERQMATWTSDSPWIAISVAAVPWFDPIGVPACDRYLSQQWRCDASDLRMWLMEREALQTQAADSPARRRKLAESCDARRTLASKRTFGEPCDWSTAAPMGKASKRIAHGWVSSARAQLSDPPRDRDGRVGAGGVRSEIAWLYAGRSLTTIDRVPTALRSLIEQAELGTVSGPIESDGAYWLVLVEGRWPAGAVPLEARREQLVADATLRLEQQASADLPLRLREGHDIEVLRYETETRALLAAPVEHRHDGQRRDRDPATVLFRTFDDE